MGTATVHRICPQLTSVVFALVVIWLLEKKLLLID